MKLVISMIFMLSMYCFAIAGYCANNEIDPFSCKTKICYKTSINKLISKERPEQYIAYVIESYKQMLSDNEYKNYLFTLIQRNRSKNKVSRMLLDLLVSEKLDDPFFCQVVNLYNYKHSTLENEMVLSKFDELLLFDTPDGISQERIKCIKRANEIVIDILNNSKNHKLINTASYVAKKIMSPESYKALMEKTK